MYTLVPDLIRHGVPGIDRGLVSGVSIIVSGKKEYRMVVFEWVGSWVCFFFLFIV